MAHRILRGIAPALLLSVLVLAGCSAEEEKVTIGGMAVTNVDTVERPWGTVKVFPKMEKAEEPTSTDVTFAIEMVMHHEQALELSNNLLTHEGLEERVAATARFIVADQQNEITMVNAWLTAWDQAAGESGEGPTAQAHAEHQMPGMLSAKRVAKIAALPMPAAQIAFLQAMIEHHDGAITMSRDYLPVQTNSYLRSTAQHIITEQLTEIQYMENLLEEFCNAGQEAACSGQ